MQGPFVLILLIDFSFALVTCVAAEMTRVSVRVVNLAAWATFGSCDEGLCAVAALLVGALVVTVEFFDVLKFALGPSLVAEYGVSLSAETWHRSLPSSCTLRPTLP